MSQPLLQPILDGAVRTVAYFNGRLLSAEDLRQDREATREFLRRLGRAAGDGVAWGYEVSEAPVGVSSAAAPVLRVAGGLAVNRAGHPLSLPHAVDLELTPTSGSPPPDTGSGFANCVPGPAPPPGNAGLMLLVICPAQTPEGQAPVSGLSSAAASCNTRYLVEGVRFRTVPLPLTFAEFSDPDRLRNDAAYRCFGVASADYLLRFRDPFGTVPSQYGLLDMLRAGGVLTDCDVPLALIRLTAAGIAFIDPWAVRRRVTRSDPGVPGPFPTDRRTAEGEAMIAQFRDHVRDLLAGSLTPETVQAGTFFRLLPPAGLLPIQGPRSPRGFDLAAFFGGRAPASPDVIDGEQLLELFREAALHAPIDLSGSTAVRVYLIRENLIAEQGTGPVQRAAVFTHPGIRFRGLARFGHAHWGFDQFAPSA
jgi:hypothetical protein